MKIAEMAKGSARFESLSSVKHGFRHFREQLEALQPQIRRNWNASEASHILQRISACNTGLTATARDMPFLPGNRL